MNAPLQTGPTGESPHGRKGDAPSERVRPARRMVFDFWRPLRRHGPLGLAIRACGLLQKRLNTAPGCRRPLLWLEGVIRGVHRRLDGAFDRQHGTDTSGVVPVENLGVASESLKEAVWYEPMSVKVFRQIMDHLPIAFGEFEFIDFGSGKGRVLLLASARGFKRVTGVEISPQLHCIATQNVAIVERRTGRPSGIETVCLDATAFAIPAAPLVIFFYSPFKGNVMGKVLSNISSSFARNPRDIVLVFYGRNPESIALLKATGFPCRELKLRNDWSRLHQYRSLLFASPGVQGC